MMTFKSRKYNRFESFKLISYICLDDNNKTINQGMGRTLNVSKGGILLETHLPIDTQYVISLAIGIDEELVDIKGKVVYCTEGKDEMFESGIEFLEFGETALQILNKYIILFNEQKNKKKI